MATTISTQDIVNAKRDIEDIGKAVNEKLIVSPRYGEDFKSLPMISAEFQISSDAAEAAAVSAAESANIAEAAATAATISANVFPTPAAGVDPVNGVADGAYFNVRSPDDESYIDEYQNVGGVATPTGKSYPSSKVVDQLRQGIKSIAQLRLTTPAAKGDRVYLVSVNEGQGEGGGDFVATQKSGLIDDGGLVVSSPDPLLFWVRTGYESVTPEMFGYDNVDGWETIQKAWDSGIPVLLHAKDYKTSKPLKVTDNLTLKGSGSEKTRIVKFGSDAVTIDGASVDCAVYSDGSLTNYIANLNWSDFSIVKESILGVDAGIALNLRYTQRSKFSSIYVTGGATAISSVDGWMIDWTRCEGRADIPWDLNTGTSNNFKSCWARNGQTYGWKIHNLDYSTLISCGADYTGRDGSPAEAVYYITNSHLSMISCGSEQTHAYNTLYAYYSWITVIDPHFYTIYNKYTHSALNRQGLISINHADSIVNIIGGHMQPAYNNETTPVGIPHVVVEDAAITTDNVFFIKEINDIRDVDWGFIIRGYALVDYSYKGQSTVVDRRNDVGSKRRRDYTDKSLAFRHTDMSNTSADVGRGLHDKFLFSQNFTDTDMVAGWGHIINMTNAVVDGDVWSSSAQLALSTQDNVISWRRGQSGNAFSGWMELLHSANTTVDGNGFIKAASPIVKLFSERIELNDDAEKQGIALEKLGVGDYLIKGSNGFAQEGWYIETPKDANGNVLFSVVYTTLESGDISVKTYKKKFDVETASIVADLDKPVDIADGRWIDLRLQVATNTDET